MPLLHVQKPESTFLLWIDCRTVETNSQKIVDDLAQNYGITVNAGKTYGLVGDGFIRMNVACPRVTLEKGVAALLAWYTNQL